MALLTANAISRDGLQAVLVAADVAGDEFVNTGKEFIVIDNASGGNLTATFDIQKTIDGQAVTDRAVVIPTGERWYVGPFQTGVYNDNDSHVNVAYSTVTSVTVFVAKLTPA